MFNEVYLEFFRWKKETNDWYLIISTDSNRGSPLMEIHKYKRGRNLLTWTYPPRKQDGRNEDRKKLFQSRRGSLDVDIRIPQSSSSVDDWLDFIYSMVFDRVAADSLVKLSNRKASKNTIVSRPYNTDAPEFDLSKLNDAKNRINREIAARHGQGKFRRDLIEAYEAKCAITGCSIEEVLDAAHIIPYRGAITDNVQNGLLLRTDIHSLWDKSLIGIEPKTHTVRVAAEYRKNPYTSLNMRKVKLPRAKGMRPSKDALKIRWEEFKNRRK